MCRYTGRYTGRYSCGLDLTLGVSIIRCVVRHVLLVCLLELSLGESLDLSSDLGIRRIVWCVIWTYRYVCCYSCHHACHSMCCPTWRYTCHWERRQKYCWSCVIMLSDVSFGRVGTAVVTHALHGSLNKSLCVLLHGFVWRLDTRVFRCVAWCMVTRHWTCQWTGC